MGLELLQNPYSRELLLDLSGGSLKTPLSRQSLFDVTECQSKTASSLGVSVKNNQRQLLNFRAACGSAQCVNSWGK